VFLGGKVNVGYHYLTKNKELKPSRVSALYFLALTKWKFEKIPFKALTMFYWGLLQDLSSLWS